MNFQDINYSGQRLDDKEFRFKVRTGEDIYNVTGDAICGEIFLVTGESPALYIAKSTSTSGDHGVYKLKDLNEKLGPTGEIIIV